MLKTNTKEREDMDESISSRLNEELHKLAQII